MSGLRSEGQALPFKGIALFALPFEGRAGERMALASSFQAQNQPHPYPNPPLEREGLSGLSLEDEASEARLVDGGRDRDR